MFDLMYLESTVLQVAREHWIVILSSLFKVDNHFLQGCQEFLGDTTI